MPKKKSAPYRFLRSLKKSFLQTSSPRFIRRRLAAIRRREAAVTELESRMEKVTADDFLPKTEKTIAEYRELAETVRQLESERQLNPETFTPKHKALLKSARDKLASWTILIANTEKRANEAKSLSRDIRLTKISIKVDRLRYLYSIVISNLQLITLAFIAVSLMWNLGVISKAVAFITSGSTVARVIGVIGIFSIGSAFYWLRVNWRRLYAATEISIAILTAWVTLKDHVIMVDTSKQLTLAGAIYLIVRALDNFMQGQEAATTKQKSHTATVTSLPASGKSTQELISPQADSVQ
ncbi:hypothetical protein ACN469_12235 [Corallococcus terminator]